MTRRRAPMLPQERQAAGTRAQRTISAGRVTNAAPVSKAAQAAAQAMASVGGSDSGRVSKVDLFTLASDGAQDLDLTYLPVDDSWNVSIDKLVGEEGEDFDISGQTLQILAGELDPLTGDRVRIQYDYLAGLPAEPVEVPTSIPGLRLWLSADAITGYSDNDQITGSWEDLSGNNFDGTPVGTTKPKYRTTAGQGGGPAVEFPNDGYFTFGDVMASAADGEAFMTVKGNGANTGLWSFGQDTGNSDEAHYPFSGIVYEHFGKTTGDRQSFGPSVAISSWRRYNAWSATNDWAVNLDETLQGSDSSNTVGWSTAPVIGAGVKNGSVDLKFNGWIGCVLVYNRKLTTDERADLAAWLTDNPSGGSP